MKDILQKEIKAALNKYQDIERVRHHLKDLDKRLAVAYKENKKLEKRLAKEEADVEKLEKLSVKGLFYKVLGSKEDQLEKERQEYLEAALKYNESKKSIDLMEFEQETLNKKMGKAAAIEKELKGLMKRREKALMKGNTPEGRKLLQLSKVVDTKILMKREIKEAVVVGKRSAEQLSKIAAYLNRAGGWGQWQQQSGYHRKSSMDKARELSYHAKHNLLKFEQELRDVYGNRYTEIAKNLKDFSSFSDIFIQSLMIDWIIQQKIKNALSNTQYVRDRVINILHTLSKEFEKIDLEIEEIYQQKDQILLAL